MIRAGCDGPAGENAGSFTAVAAQGPRGLDILDETGGRLRPWRCAPVVGPRDTTRRRDFADSHGTPFSRTVSLKWRRVRPLSPPVRCACLWVATLPCSTPGLNRTDQARCRPNASRDPRPCVSVWKGEPNTRAGIPKTLVRAEIGGSRSAPSTLPRAVEADGKARPVANEKPEDEEPKRCVTW